MGEGHWGCSSTVHEHDLFQVNDDVDLASHVLKNMLITPNSSAAVKAPKCDPALEQSFKGEGDGLTRIFDLSAHLLKISLVFYFQHS
jgi:hypothetical protein